MPPGIILACSITTNSPTENGRGRYLGRNLRVGELERASGVIRRGTCGVVVGESEVFWADVKDMARSQASREGRAAAEVCHTQRRRVQGNAAVQSRRKAEMTSSRALALPGAKARALAMAGGEGQAAVEVLLLLRRRRRCRSRGWWCVGVGGGRRAIAGSAGAGAAAATPV